jgi:Spy/CpxP family protein refolding chaperone
MTNGDGDEIVLPELPFLSLRPTPAVAEGVSLTQSAGTDPASDDACSHQIEPLIAQLRSMREKPWALDLQPSNEKEVQTLADAQAALLAKSVVADGRMQSEICKIRTPEQQQKLHHLKQNGD